MSHRRFFDHDPVTGITEYFHYDPMNGDVAIETIQDVEPILDANKADQNNPDLWKDGVKGSLAPYATIPVIVQLQWIQKYGAKNDPLKPENKKLLLKLLASREWGYLRRTSKIHL
jgi:hypothetical protein